ncbi:hypothetical protein CCU68_15930 [Pseudomonas gingeri NCPPB 3146 = LMG 5327]|uniref:Uncharacterized protein n=1 Tax=Pseudomonas gingeri NCPPB 3146 = LMG 5327 TaxID=707248 RepID=A0ABX4Y2S8_9PSED|nr:hypothetical protein CCU68_15930 [Pseudomonas gingeri NCPPB 3146 = LMG 5327]
MDGQRAVFERGMLAQRPILLRWPARSKRYKNIPQCLATASVGTGLCRSRLVGMPPRREAFSDLKDAIAGKPAPTGDCCCSG